MDSIMLSKIGKEAILEMALLEDLTTTLVVLDQEKSYADEPVSLGNIDSILTSYPTRDQSFWTQMEKDNNIILTVSMLSPASKFGVEMLEDDRDGDIWGYFTRIDQNTDAVSKTYDLTAWKVDKNMRRLVPRHQSRSLRFSFNAGLRGMIPKSSDDIQISDPLIQQEFTAVSEDAHTFLKDEAIVNRLIIYLQNLFDATRKYLLTGNDSDIFYDILKRKSFNRTEILLRRDIWDIPAFRINNFLDILAERQSNAGERDGVEAKSFNMVLKVLIGFIKEMHHTERTPKIKTVKNKDKPEKQPTIRFNDEIQYIDV